jgi:hypothetical protein
MAKVGNTLVSVSSGSALVAIDPFTGGAGTTIVTLSPALNSVRGLATTPQGVLYALQDAQRCRRGNRSAGTPTPAAPARSPSRSATCRGR